jgi:myotubularin-related protein 3/4
MTSELDEPMTVPSLHSLCNVNASELYPKQDLQEATLPEDVNSDVCSEPFAPVFGESIEYLSRVSDGGVLALSNYRLVIDFTNHAFFWATIFVYCFRVFLQNEGCSYNIPLTVIEAVEVRDLFYLHILCKDAQSVR